MTIIHAYVLFQRGVKTLYKPYFSDFESHLLHIQLKYYFSLIFKKPSILNINFVETSALNLPYNIT